MSLYKITITQVAASLEGNGTYTVDAHWDIQTSASPFTGTYTAKILKSDDDTTLVSKEGITTQDVQLKGASFTKDVNYKIVVTAESVSASSPILWHTYENVKARYDGNRLRLLWDAPDRSIASGFCYVENDAGCVCTYPIPTGVRGADIPLEEEIYGINGGFTVMLQSVSGSVLLGPVVKLEKVYYPVYTFRQIKENGTRTQLGYQAGNSKAASLVFPLKGEIYKTKEDVPPEPIKGGAVLTLENTLPYTLTVSLDKELTRQDYLSFVKAAYEKVVPKAMYDIFEVISRCALQGGDDILYYYCGLDAEKRRVDVRPGFYLRLEQEMYLSRLELTDGDSAGFIGMHTADYPVTLARLEDNDCLEFDSFLSFMKEDLYLPGGDAGKKIIGAGILDLSAVRMRQPYWQIHYPDALFVSSVEPDIHPGSHAILLAAPGFTETPVPVTAEENTDTPYLIFRGRSALTLLITVTINGAEKRVPAGMTIGKLLSLTGIRASDSSGFYWYRRDPYGVEARVRLGGEDGWESLPLLNGDRIEG